MDLWIGKPRLVGSKKIVGIYDWEAETCGIEEDSWDLWMGSLGKGAHYLIMFRVAMLCLHTK
jgi:hypothetical protein